MIVFLDASRLTSAMCQFPGFSPSMDFSGITAQPSYFVSVGFPIVCFVLLKPCHLTGQPEHCCFVGVVIARNHPIRELNLIPVQMTRIIAYQYSESQVAKINYTDIKYYCTKRSR